MVGNKTDHVLKRNFNVNCVVLWTPLVAFGVKMVLSVMYHVPLQYKQD
jgi:hypothetical protein